MNHGKGESHGKLKPGKTWIMESVCGKGKTCCHFTSNNLAFHHLLRNLRIVCPVFSKILIWSCKII